MRVFLVSIMVPSRAPYRMAEWESSGMRHSGWEMEVALPFAPTQAIYFPISFKDTGFFSSEYLSVFSPGIPTYYSSAFSCAGVMAALAYISRPFGVIVSEGRWVQYFFGV